MDSLESPSQKIDLTKNIKKVKTNDEIDEKSHAKSIIDTLSVFRFTKRVSNMKSPEKNMKNRSSFTPK